MSATSALQQAFYGVLINDSSLAALLAANALEGSPTIPAVYDHVPQPSAPEDDTAFPYVAIGEFTVAEFDTDDVNGQEHTATIHAFDRGRGMFLCKQVMDAIYNALHRVRLEVSGQHAVFCFWEYSESIPDPDVLVQHGVMRFRVITQEH